MTECSLTDNWRSADLATRRLVLHWSFWLVLPVVCSETLRQAAFGALALVFFIALIKRVWPAIARLLMGPSLLLLAVFLYKPERLSHLFPSVWTYPWLFTAGACLALALAYRGISLKRRTGPGILRGYLAATCTIGLALLFRGRIAEFSWLIELPAGAVCLLLFCESLLDEEGREHWSMITAAPRKTASRLALAMGAWSPYVWLCLALLLVLALDFLLSPGSHGSADEGSNFAAAFHYLNSRGQLWHHVNGLIYDQQGKYLFDIAGCRLGLVLPSTLAYWLGGGNLGGIIALCLGYHMALVVLVYLIANRLFGRLVGTLSAFATAAWPINIFFAAGPWPEIPMAMWSGLSFLLYLYAFPDSQQQPALTPAKRLVLCGFAGIALGCAYAIKESGLLFIVPLGLFLAFDAWKLKKFRGITEIFTFLTGLALVFALETAILSSRFGKFTTKGSILSIPTSMHQAMSYPDLGERLGEAAMWLKAFFPEISLLVLAIAAIILPFWNSRTRRLWLLVGFPAAYLVLGSMSLNNFAFPPLHARSFGLLTAFLPIAYILAAKWIVIDLICDRAYAFAKPPSWLAGSILSVLVIPLIWLNIEQGYENCRSFKQGGQYNSFVEALDRAKTEYPGYPIVLADFFGEMMSPLFLGRPEHGVIYRNYLDLVPGKLAASVPFVVLTPLNKPIFFDGLDAVVQLGQDERPVLRIADMVLPPAGRMEEVADVLAKTLTVPSLSPPRPAAPFPTAIVLVEKGMGDQSERKTIFSSKTDRLPLVGQVDNVVTPTATGIGVRLEPGKQRALTYSFFTNDNAEAAPLCSLGQFPKTKGIFTLRFQTMVRINDRTPTLVASLHLYCEGKRVWTGDCKLESVPTEPVQLTISSPPEIVADAYRVVFTLQNIPPANGTWSIENVLVIRD